MGAPIELPLSNSNATPKKKKMPSQLIMAFVIGFFFICFFGVDTMYRRSSGMFFLSMTTWIKFSLTHPLDLSSTL